MPYPHILPFLTDLAANNDRIWFANNHARYELVQAETLDFTAALISQIAAFDPDIRYLQPKECLFRIYRDIRFSPNKLPYKNHIGIYIAANGGRKSIRSGYYVHLQPAECNISSGVWCPDAKQTKHFRSVIDTEYAELQHIMSSTDFSRLFGGDFVDFGNSLKSLPAGYKADHPALNWLKKRQWVVSHHFEDSMLDSNNLIDYLTTAAHTLLPFCQWCNSAMFE